MFSDGNLQCLDGDDCDNNDDGDYGDEDGYGGDDGCDGRSVACASDAIWIDTG